MDGPVFRGASKGNTLISTRRENRDVLTKLFLLYYLILYWLLLTKLLIFFFNFWADCARVLSWTAKSSRAWHCQASNDRLWWCCQFWGNFVSIYTDLQQLRFKLKFSWRSDNYCSSLIGLWFSGCWWLEVHHEICWFP